jgi:pyruvate dehydrogenase E2 component (dihydrolipoamide acetyltransferase)
MAKEFQLPELGENIEQGVVVSILVKEGESIKEDQAVLELETDKATVEVPSEVTGKIEKILISEGDTISVGQVIFTVTESDSNSEEAAEETVEASASEVSEEKKESPKEKVPAESTEPLEKERQPEPEMKPSKTPDQSAASRVIPASPAVRRFAREIGVDLNQVSGSGPNGRITIDDVKNFSRSGRLDTSAAPAATQPLPDFSSFGEISTEKFNNIRRVTAQHLSRSWAIVARVTNHDEADVTELENLRQKYKARVENAGGKLTMTAIMLKILASALKVFPKFNASIDVAKQEIIFKKYFNIGVAVDTERGLLVPVVKNVDRKNITELSIELKEIADRARKGKIGPDELQGGSITITNLGGIGGTSFTPIVNYPEVAILGLSRSSIKPVFLDGEFQPRLILPLSLSYDHRLIDGAEAARFLRWLAEALENPFLVSLEA